jgi:hypothetical protein
VAKSFTISKTKYNGSVAAHRIVSKLFAAVENFKKIKVEEKK